MIVADTNMVAYLLINGEHTGDAEATYRTDPDWIAPSSWRVEFFNVLSTYCRSGTLSVERAIETHRRACGLIRDSAFDEEPERVLNLSIRSGRSGYDCMFVAVAQMNGAPLITFDRRLREAFPEVVIPPDALNEWISRHRKPETGG